MNTSKAKLLLFLGNSYSVNQKRKVKKGKNPTERALKALQTQVAEVGWVVRDLGLLCGVSFSVSSVHFPRSPEELPMVCGGDKHPSLVLQVLHTHIHVSIQLSTHLLIIYPPIYPPT